MEFKIAEIQRNGRITMIIAKVDNNIGNSDNSDNSDNDNSASSEDNAISLNNIYDSSEKCVAIAYMLFSKFDYNKPKIPEQFLKQLFELKSFVVR